MYILYHLYHIYINSDFQENQSCETLAMMQISEVNCVEWFFQMQFKKRGYSFLQARILTENVTKNV